MVEYRVLSTFVSRRLNFTSLLEKCSNHDLRLSVKKLQFNSPSVTFMGHKLTDKGVEPDPAKVAAITEMPTPTDKSGLQRFLGMCQYLASSLITCQKQFFH